MTAYLSDYPPAGLDPEPVPERNAPEAFDARLQTLAEAFDTLADEYAKSSEHEADEAHEARWWNDPDAARDHDAIANIQAGRSLGMALAARLARSAR